MAREAVFSEGRGLRARVAGPEASQRIPSQPDGSTMSRWPEGEGNSVGVMPTSRACGARPSGGRQAQDAWPNGENREITRRVVFSEGRGLRARAAGPYQRQGVAFSPDDDARGRMAYRAHASVRRNAFLPGVRGLPLRETGTPTRRTSGSKGEGPR